MATIEDIAASIRRRDVSALLDMMFEDDPPRIRNGYATENDFWDFKGGCPAPGKAQLVAWAELAIDVLAFHNAKGGVIVFGVDDAHRSKGRRNTLIASYSTIRFVDFFPIVFGSISIVPSSHQISGTSGLP